MLAVVFCRCLFSRIARLRPAQVMAMGLGQQERFQPNVVAFELWAVLQFLDPLCKPYLRIIEIIDKIPHPFRIDKGDGLGLGLQKPEDEVGAESTLAKEADGVIGTVIAQQIQLDVGQHSFRFGFAQSFQIVHEAFFPFVQMRGYNLQQGVVAIVVA